jgi:hypothetical protein
VNRPASCRTTSGSVSGTEDRFVSFCDVLEDEERTTEGGMERGRALWRGTGCVGAGLVKDLVVSNELEQGTSLGRRRTGLRRGPTCTLVEGESKAATSTHPSSGQTFRRCNSHCIAVPRSIRPLMPAPIAANRHLFDPPFHPTNRRLAWPMSTLSSGHLARQWAPRGKRFTSVHLQHALRPTFQQDPTGPKHRGA